MNVAKCIRLNRPSGNAHENSMEAFTFVDLLAALGVLCCAMFLMLPALATNQSSNSTARCINNFRQLGYSWMMYATDTQGNIIESHPWARDPVFGNRIANTANPFAWAPGYAGTNPAGSPSVAPTSDYHATNPVGLTKTVFYRYHGDTRLLHCPSDDRTVAGVPVLRSYSMNNWMNGAAVGASGTAIFTNLSQIIRPSTTWVLMDEDGITIDDAYFVLFVDGRGFVNMPTTRHNNGYILNYADGHAEAQRLQDNRSIVQKSTTGAGIGSSVDYAFLTNRAVYFR